MEMEQKGQGERMLQVPAEKLQVHPISGTDPTDTAEFRQRTRGPSHLIVS